VFIYPFIHIFNLSISDSFAIDNGEVSLLPKGFQLFSYMIVLRSSAIWVGYMNSIIYSVSGTFLTLLLCSSAAYVLNTREFKFKKMVMVYFVITMFFSGGVIPSFLVVKNLGMMNTIWAIIIPPALSAWFIILFKTNFKSIPYGLLESAKIDGANHFTLYWLIINLSKPIFATLALFAVVGYWNSFFSALLYITSQNKQPLMMVLRKFLVSGNMRGEMEQLMGVAFTGGKEQSTMGLERSIKAAATLISLGPIVLLYPFLQKYFVKGILVGSIKG